jgi:hypothetical protein
MNRSIEKLIITEVKKVIQGCSKKKNTTVLSVRFKEKEEELTLGNSTIVSIKLEFQLAVVFIYTCVCHHYTKIDDLLPFRVYSSRNDQYHCFI